MGAKRNGLFFTEGTALDFKCIGHRTQVGQLFRKTS